MRVKATIAVLMPSGCWAMVKSIRRGNGPLLKPTSKQGYVVRCLGSGRKKPAHRIMYEKFFGPIPDGLTLDHLCKNTSCVHPAHLDPCSRGENARRGRSFNGNKTHCKRGHPFVDGNYSIKFGLAGQQRRCKLCRRKPSPAGLVRPRATN